MSLTIDFDTLPTYSDQADQLINAIVEIPAGTKQKIEWQSQEKIFLVDRELPCTLPESVVYGFIPQTLSGDGDNLDVLILTDQQLETGQILSVKVIGVMLSEDDGEEDHKIITCLQSDILCKDRLDEVKPKIIQFFDNYKEKNGQYKIIAWEDAKRAHFEINKTQVRWSNQLN